MIIIVSQKDVITWYALISYLQEYFCLFTLQKDAMCQLAENTFIKDMVAFAKDESKTSKDECALETKGVGWGGG